MEKSSYINEYILYKDNKRIDGGKMRVKNVEKTYGKIFAKLKLDKHLSETIDYDRMEVLSCEEDKDIWSLFNNMFGSGSSNPFK